MNLLEAIIAFYIVIVFTLASTKLERRCIQVMEDVYFYNVAITQLFSLTERLANNDDPIYVRQQIALWQNENKKLLPNGNGVISRKQNLLHVKLSWREYFTRKMNYCELTR